MQVGREQDVAWRGARQLVEQAAGPRGRGRRSARGRLLGEASRPARARSSRRAAGTGAARPARRHSRRRRPAITTSCSGSGSSRSAVPGSQRSRSIAFALAVELEQPHGRIAVPEAEAVALVLALHVRHPELQHRPRPVGARDRRDPGGAHLDPVDRRAGSASDHSSSRRATASRQALQPDHALRPSRAQIPGRAHAGIVSTAFAAAVLIDARGVELSPILAGLEQYPFARLDDWRADARRRGIDVIDFGVGDPREVTPAFIRDALVAGIASCLVPARGRAARAARGDRRVDRRGATASRSARARSCRRSARRRRSSRSRRSRSASAASSPCPSPRIRSTSAARCSPARASSPCRCARRQRLAARPRRVRCLGRAGRVLGLLPEQPDRRDGAARVLRGARRPRARARLPRLLGRGVLRAVVRRAAGVGAPGRRPRAHRRLQHAVEALVDDRLPLGLRLRAAVDRRRAARVPPVARHGAAGVRPARVGRRVVGRGSTSTRCARSTATSARPSSPRSRLRASGSRAATRRSSSGWRSTSRPRPVARRLLEQGILVAPGSFFGPAGEGYVRLALVPTQAECERAAAILSGRSALRVSDRSQRRL